MAEFYSARGWEIPPLPWTNLSPPFSEGGGEVADDMARVYGYILCMLPRVNRLADLETASEVLRVLAPLRDAWLAVNDNHARPDGHWYRSPKSARPHILDA